MERDGFRLMTILRIEKGTQERSLPGFVRGRHPHPVCPSVFLGVYNVHA